MVSYAIFSGISKFLFETRRYSDKQFDRAVEMSQGMEPELIAAVVAKNKTA
jgi:hypothetical protein